jgi:hypothetical protein
MALKISIAAVPNAVFASQGKAVCHRENYYFFLCAFALSACLFQPFFNQDRETICEPEAKDTCSNL